MALALRYAARSDTGLIRAINEDSGYAGPRLLVIADGVGGHAAGEVASSVAVASMAALDEDSPGGDLLERLSAAVTNANQHLRDMVHGDPDLKGMGTTLTAVLRAGSRLGLVHVGDSRAYLLRGETFQQLTHDHTFVQTLVDEGRITAEEADHHPQRNLITNSLDGREDIELDLSVRETKAGDRYLLCSDGLSGVVSEDTLRDTLLDEADTDVVVERLVDLALKGGGPDNITAIVADVVEVETKPPSAVPVTVGAAAQGVVQRSPGDTPAGKAAALTPPPEDEQQDEDADHEPRQRRRGRLLVALVLLLLLAVAGGYGAYRWSQTQYYVGAEGSSVAIFRGLTQDVGPVATSELYSDEDIPLSDLPAYQQERVRADIPTAGLTDAHRIVATLREQAELCREQAAAAASPSPTASATPTASASPEGESASPAPSPTPSPTGSTTDGGVSAADCGDGS
jgi:protein phosphatase